jgi:arsenic resistance protein ArsH
MRYNLLRAVTLFRLNHHLCRATTTVTTVTTATVTTTANQSRLLSSQSIRGGAISNTNPNININTNTRSIEISNNQSTKHLSTDTTSEVTMDNQKSEIWSINTDEDNGAAFASLSHIGYSLQSDPTNQTGGWLAHRLATEPKAETEEGTESTALTNPPCWIRDEVASKLTKFNYEEMPIGRPPRILVLYGSLRPTSFSKKLAYEFARLLETLGCDVRTYNPSGLPVRDPSLENHYKVQELRSLTLWSDGHVWVSPEMHGQLTGTFKNQIDWIPLNTGSIRPTQGRTCCLAQVNGGSQSFNAVNTLRLLARWMRMPCCTNQSSVPKAWQEFDDNGRMKDSSYRERVVDVAEEFAKFTAVMAPVSDDLTNRYSERKEKEKEGKLLTQAEKEAKKTVTESRKG